MALIIKEVSANTVTEVGNVIIIEGGGLTPDQSTKIDNLPTNTLTSLAAKVDKVTGKGLSTNDYTTTDYNKVQNLPTNTTTSLAAKADLVGGKIPVAQIPDSITGGVVYQGTWNATTNTPALIDGTGTNGHYYKVSVAGSQDLGSGSISFAIGDWVIYNGTTWDKIDQSEIVTSVNSQTGAVTITVPTALSDLSEDSTHRIVTDAEKSIWNSKADAGDIPTTLDDLTATSTSARISATEKASYLTSAVIDGLADAISITGTHTETTTAIDFSTVQGKAITMTADRSYTTSTGLSASNPVGLLKVTHKGFTPTFSDVDVVLDSPLDKSGVYYLKFTRQPDGTITQSNQSGGGASNLSELDTSVTGAELDIDHTIISLLASLYVPDAPTIVTSLDASNNIVVDFTEGASNGGFDVIGYKVEIMVDGADWVEEISLTTDDPYTITNPGIGDHSVRAYSINAIGTSSASNIETKSISSSITADYTTHSISLTGASNIQGYGVSLPSNYATNSNDYPTIFFFHGAGQAGTNLAVLDDDGILETSTLRDWYASKGFLLIAPQSSDTTNYWQFLHDDVNAFIAWAMKTYRINPNKIYLTGLSAGAEGILQMTVGSGGTQISIQPAAVVPVAGAVGVNDTFSTNTNYWLFRNESDVISAGMDDAIEDILADSETQEALFSQFVGSDHSGANSAWDFVYKTGTNDSTVAHSMGTDPVSLPGGGTTPNTTFPGTSPKNTMADWMLSKAMGGASTIPTFTFTLNAINTVDIDFDINTDLVGDLYILALDANSATPSNLNIYANYNHKETISSTGAQTITVTGLPSGTKDIYAMLQSSAYGTRARASVLEDIAVPVLAALRTANINMQYFGGSVSDAEWVNTASVQSGTLLSNMNDSTGTLTTWDIAATGCTNDNAIGGTATEETALSLPSGTLSRGRSGTASGVNGTIVFTDLDDTKQYKVTLYSYHQYANREFTAQLGSNTSVSINASAGAVVANLGYAQPASGTITINLTVTTGKLFTFSAITIEEFNI